ncbi:MAG: hypothetical protein JWO41_34 [Candidatus Saccharibacteria bacterium]|nr:hypothetical protein [Candidatus Saccharibacteria bacterium]
MGANSGDPSIVPFEVYTLDMYERPKEVAVFTPVQEESLFGKALGGAAVRADIVDLNGEVVRSSIFYAPTRDMIDLVEAKVGATSSAAE